LGHSGDSTVCDHLAELADAGFTLGMDRVGIPWVLERGVSQEQIDTMLVDVPRRYVE
jgi:predicted metal-dependent phosphotriesterase family hydrolase